MSQALTKENVVERLKLDLATFETYCRCKQNPRRRHIALSIEKDLVYVS